MNARRIFVKALLIATLAAAPLAGQSAQLPATGKPKIGLIGSGNVGSNLGKVWVSKGYAVMFSSKDIEACLLYTSDAADE